ncbi:MAG: tol-pal system-associated acyl-CoA thioesterase [Methylophilaceae bacterium]|jgi:tol-pal system-associated acyl-CoA thioesterase
MLNPRMINQPALPIFQWPVRVYYEDTDAGGVVYHSQYLNFMERARTEWLRSLGFEQEALRDSENILFVVHSMQVLFKKSAKFDDILSVDTQLMELRRSSFVCTQKIIRQGALATQAQVKIVCVNAVTFKPTGIPTQIKRKMESI